MSKAAMNLPTPGNRAEWREGYFLWLKDFVHASGVYDRLLSCMHEIEYRPRIGNDDDRAKDGIGLRYSYIRDAGLLQTDGVREALGEACSFLEMLVALCDRMDYIMYTPKNGGRAYFFFWEIIRNLGLDGYGNDAFEQDRHAESIIRRVVENVNDGRFRPDGIGGMFPLTAPARLRTNQRRLEIWAQMGQYLDAKYGVSGYLENG